MQMRQMAVLVVLAWGLAAWGGGAAVGPGRGGQFTDPANGFSMAVPAFGEAKAERSVVVVFQAVPIAEDGFTPNVTVMVDPVKTTRDDYLKASQNAILSNNPRAGMREPKKLQVSGKDAVLLDFDANMTGRRLRFLQLMVIAEDRVYVVTCTAPLDSFSNYLPQFQKCVDSFKVEK